MRTRRLTSILIVTTILVGTTFVLKTRLQTVQAHGPKKTQTDSQAAKGTPVEIQDVKTGTVLRTIPVTGSLIAQQDVVLAAKMPGRLSQILVREGDSVTAGQMIARLDTTDIESQIRSAEAAVEAANARVAQAEAAYKQQIVSSGSAVQSAEAAYRQQKVDTRTGVESAEAGLRSAEAGQQSAEAGLRAAKAALSQVKEGARSQEVASAEAQVSIARVNLSKAEVDARRFKALLKEGAVAPIDVERYETTYQVAKEQLRSAEQSLSLVKEGARSQEIIQAEQNVRQSEQSVRQSEQGVRQAEEKVRQARAASARDEVKMADVQTARAALAQNDVRRADVEAARASLRQMQSSLAIARQSLSDAAICAPLSGRIAARSIEPGQIVAAGTPVARIVALDSITFEPSVPSVEIGHIKVGQKVAVSVDAFPGRTFAGEVVRVYPAGSAQSRSFPIRIRVANPERALRPQMFARGQIEATRRIGVTLVPSGAVMREKASAQSQAKGRIFTIENGKASERNVTLGLPFQDGKWIEVKGISAPAQVVVMGQGGLKDGEAVSVMTSGSKQSQTGE
jgi:HlyD family secretion protein